MYDVILFDLDGTLTDPGEGITNSVAYALEQFGISVPDRTQLYPFIGPPLYESFMTFYGFDRETALLAVERYREYYRDRGIWENRVYDGIPALLERLKEAGRILLLATSKPELFARQILEHYGLAPYLDGGCGASMDSSLVRKADIIARALAEQGLEPGPDVLMVGDREHDVLGAKALGLDAVGVLFGYGSRAELEQAGAVYLADSPAAVGRFILS